MIQNIKKILDFNKKIYLFLNISTSIFSNAHYLKDDLFYYLVTFYYNHNSYFVLPKKHLD